jgi:hypothetical protein
MLGYRGAAVGAAGLMQKSRKYAIRKSRAQLLPLAESARSNCSFFSDSFRILSRASHCFSEWRITPLALLGAK